MRRAGAGRSGHGLRRDAAATLKSCGADGSTDQEAIYAVFDVELDPFYNGW